MFAFSLWAHLLKVSDSSRRQMADSKHLLLLLASLILSCIWASVKFAFWVAWTSEVVLSGQIESISAQRCFTSGRLRAVCSAAGILSLLAPKTFLVPPDSSYLLQTVFYNVVWSLSWGAATSNSRQRCPPPTPQPPPPTTHATLIPRRPLSWRSGCGEREAHLGRQPFYFPSDWNVLHSQSPRPTY